MQQTTSLVSLLIGYLFTCGPLVLVLAAWVKLWRDKQWPRGIPLVTLGVVALNATFAAWNFLYYQIRPVDQHVPPWHDPKILNFSMLCLLAPAGIILGLIAAAKGPPKLEWLGVLLLVASLPLLLVGLLSAMAV